MSVDSLEERTVEVLKLPSGVDEELLFLYFENKRRSGGGPLISVEKNGDVAILVFEEAEAAARVLSKGSHVLHNVELSVRKPASKDRYRLLLQGINPNTETEMIELFVENMMGLNLTDYILHRSPGRDLILIHLSQPVSKAFQNLRAKISERKLDGAKVTLEQIKQTDSILVENLHPGTTKELLTLYFESKGGGYQDVKEVTMLSEGTAKVSFVNYDSVSRVLTQTHKLEAADLAVTPYFHFLQPAQNLTAQDPEAGSQNTTERNADNLSDMQTSPATMASANSQSSFPMALEPLAAREAAEQAAEEVVEDPTEGKDTLSSHIAIADPTKLALFQLGTFRQDTEKTHSNVTIQVKDNGVHIECKSIQTLEQIKQSLLDCFGEMTEVHFTLEPEEAELLARKDVKEQLLQTMSQTGSPAVYAVSDCNIVVAALSQNSANRACSFLKSQLGHFSIPGDSEYEYMFYCREWSEFLQALGFSCVKVSERGGNIDVTTLAGMENEKRTAILEFLSTPIEREAVISMEPGILKYIQIQRHLLLADMDQVSIFPLEAEDSCGFKIHGNAVACQMAEEVLQDVVSSIFSNKITVNAPGVTRYLYEEECKSVLKEMETKFEVYICVDNVPWEPLPQQDIFETAWTMMSHKNFRKASFGGSEEVLKSGSVQTDHNGATARGLLHEAKSIVSAIDERMKDGVFNPDLLNDLDNVDLYSAEPTTSGAHQDSDVIAVEENTMSGLLQLNDGAQGLPSNLEEEAQLSLAIQYSMEMSHCSLQKEEEEQLQIALELSKTIQHEASFSSTEENPQVDHLKKGVDMSIQDAIKAANTLQLIVFAGYNCDLLRVEIAFGKKVSQRQVEEKLEHKTLNNMSEYHRTCLDVIRRKHAVGIQVQGTIITVSGFKDFVTGGLSDVKLLLDKMSNSVSDQEILRTVQWVHHDPVSSQTTPYSPDATVVMENVWRMKLKQIDILLDNQPHTINFEKMQEYNVASGKSVKISRKLVTVGDWNEDVPEEEYSLLSNLPEANKVDEASDEYRNVVKNFYATMKEDRRNIRIIQVEKLLNRLLYNQYKLKKASVLQRATYPEVERTLYHGTSETSVKEICVHGFNRSFCGKNATIYGQGVYFAVNSALSVYDQYSPPNADGHKFVFVSKVLTGDYTKGCHSMRTAPLKETGDIPLRYDSVTNNVTNPSMFVIFNDTQAFPEYLITCQRIQR